MKNTLVKFKFYIMKNIKRKIMLLVIVIVVIVLNGYFVTNDSNSINSSLLCNQRKALADMNPKITCWSYLQYEENSSAVLCSTCDSVDDKKPGGGEGTCRP